VLNFQAGTSNSSVVPCQPGLGTLSAGVTATGTSNLCTSLYPCKVEVLDVHGGWKAFVAATAQTTTFGSSATGVVARFAVEVKRPEGPGAEIPGARGATTGEVDFLVTPSMPNEPPRLLPVDLRFGDGTTLCGTASPYSMYCFP
jgi:hypothetical protein